MSLSESKLLDSFESSSLKSMIYYLFISKITIVAAAWSRKEQVFLKICKNLDDLVAVIIIEKMAREENVFDKVMKDGIFMTIELKTLCE